MEDQEKKPVKTSPVYRLRFLILTFSIILLGVGLVLAFTDIKNTLRIIPVYVSLAITMVGVVYNFLDESLNNNTKIGMVIGMFIASIGITIYYTVSPTDTGKEVGKTFGLIIAGVGSTILSFVSFAGITGKKENE
jgi:hypothetical protein